MRRIILLTLALVMVLSCFAACGKKKDETPVQTGEQNTQEEYYLNTLTKNYDDDEILICTIADNAKDGANIEAAVDFIEEAEMLRDLKMEEKFDVEIKYDVLSGNHMDRIRTMAIVEDGADIIIQSALNLMTISIEGSTKDLNSIQSLELEKEWWSQHMIETTEIKGRLFTMAGAVSRFYYAAPHALVFNKAMATNYGLPDLYEIVNAGNWTLEEMEKISTEYGIYNEDLEQYPLSFNTHNTHYTMLVGCGVQLAKVDDDGVISVSHLNDEETKNVMEDILKAVDPNTNFFGDKDASWEVFNTGRSLFWLASFGYMPGRLAETEIDYGIIPTPKRDTAQKDYISCGFPSSSYCVAVPARLESTYAEWIGTFLNGWTFLGQDQIRPTYYDAVMKYQVAMDPLASEMISMIFDSVYIDLNMISNFGGTSKTMGDVLQGSMPLSAASRIFAAAVDSIAADIAKYDALVNPVS